MDLSAGVFAFVLLTAAVVVTYQWGIKPEREAKKRRAEQLREATRRQQEKSRLRFVQRHKPITHRQSGAHM